MATITPQAASSHLSKLVEGKLVKVERHGRHCYYQLARVCYDHLAGKLAIDLTESMLRAGYLEKGERKFVVTSKGNQFFASFGLELEVLKKKRRQFSHACLDWSERQHHLAGALGSGLLARLLEREWIVRVPAICAVKITEKGRKGFGEHFNFTV